MSKKVLVPYQVESTPAFTGRRMEQKANKKLFYDSYLKLLLEKKKNSKAVPYFEPISLGCTCRSESNQNQFFGRPCLDKWIALSCPLCCLRSIKNKINVIMPKKCKYL